MPPRQVVVRGRLVCLFFVGGKGDIGIVNGTGLYLAKRGVDDITSFFLSGLEQIYFSRSSYCYTSKVNVLKSFYTCVYKPKKPEILVVSEDERNIISV